MPDIENKIAIILDKDSYLIRYFLYSAIDDTDDELVGLSAEVNHIAEQLKKNGIGGK